MPQILASAEPPSVRDGLALADDLAAAQAFTRKLTRRHYENFSVVSQFVPRPLRQDFCNIYAFCRIADDAGDETGDSHLSLELLGKLKAMVHDCAAGRAKAAMFVALRDTMQRHELPARPFLDLIDAFEQDQRVSRYETFDQLLDYCRRSANPVGRLVLYLCGYRDEERFALSDQTCTALQLTNFWQDVRRDFLERNRIYIPREAMDEFGVTEEQIRSSRCNDKYRRLIQSQVDRTEAMFAAGDALPPMLGKKYRKQIALFSRGGRAILQAIRRQEYDTLSQRPSLSRWQKSRLAMGMLIGVSA